MIGSYLCDRMSDAMISEMIWRMCDATRPFGRRLFCPGIANNSSKMNSRLILSGYPLFSRYLISFNVISSFVSFTPRNSYAGLFVPLSIS